MRNYLNVVQPRSSLIVAVFVASSMLAGCAAMNPPNATGPTGPGSLYPVLLTEDSQRKDSVLLSLNRLSSETATTTEPQLQPVTATILKLAPQTPLYLPKVGSGPAMTEEDTRESLRRFIKEWQQLIGSDPLKLSLVERTDQPDGTKVALYEQRPFRYPIRGGYGKLEIKFASDRRVISLASSCIPDAERIQSAISALTLRPRVDDTLVKLRQQGVNYVDANGNKLSFALPPSSEITPHGLTTFVLPAKNRADTLEFHLAWEIELSNAPVKLIYVDAVTGNIVGTA
jgi:hypothetical protein